MSRSGYSEDYEAWSLIRWRGAVASALRGKRGQAFLREMLEALEELPEKRLIAHELEKNGEFCALGAVGKKRGMDLVEIDPEDHESVAQKFNIAHAMACEIMFENDEIWGHNETPEDRYNRVKKWAQTKIGRSYVNK